MIFKKAYRAIEFNDDYTMEELCDQINQIPNSNLYATLHKDRITVTKKKFSDFSPFSFGHLGALTIQAKSVEIESESENLEFVIDMNDFMQLSTYGSIFLLGGLIVLALLSGEIGIASATLIFITIAVLWSNVVHNWGIDNFTKNWDKHIGTKV